MHAKSAAASSGAYFEKLVLHRFINALAWEHSE